MNPPLKMKNILFILLIVNNIYSQKNLGEYLFVKNNGVRIILSFETDSIFTQRAGSSIKTGFYKVKNDSLILTYHKPHNNLTINTINILSKKKHKREFDSINMKLYSKEYKELSVTRLIESQITLDGVTKTKSNITESLNFLANNSINDITHKLHIIANKKDSIYYELEKSFDYEIEITNDLSQLKYKTENILYYSIKEWTPQDLILIYYSDESKKRTFRYKKINRPNTHN